MYAVHQTIETENARQEKLKRNGYVWRHLSLTRSNGIRAAIFTQVIAIYRESYWELEILSLKYDTNGVRVQMSICLWKPSIIEIGNLKTRSFAGFSLHIRISLIHVFFCIASEIRGNYNLFIVVQC